MELRPVNSKAEAIFLMRKGGFPITVFGSALDGVHFSRMIFATAILRETTALIP
jgi:hypothetical protein